MSRDTKQHSISNAQDKTEGLTLSNTAASREQGARTVADALPKQPRSRSDTI